MSGIWFGAIGVGLVTDKDTDISKEITEKNFVDKPVQVYELTPNLESGNYSVIFLEETHPKSPTTGKGTTIEEQRDAVLSMPDRHVTEFPFDFAGDKGHVLVSNANASITPSNMINEGEISIRFFDDNDYRPAFQLESQSYNDVFDLGDTSVVALPEEVQNVSESEDFQLLYSATFDKLNLYKYSSSKTLEYDRPSDFTSGERKARCLVERPDGSYIFSSMQEIALNAFTGNDLIKNKFESSSTRVSSGVGGAYSYIGDLNFDVTNGYIKNPSNYELELGFAEDQSLKMRKGFSTARYTITNQSSFKFTSSETPLSLVDDSNSAYNVVSDGLNREIILIRTSTDGNFNVTSDVLEVTGLDSSKEYTFFFGEVPDGIIPYQDYAEYVYNIGRQKRTLVQR